MHSKFSTLVEGVIAVRSTKSRVEYSALAPSDFRVEERLPLVLHLHGAMSSAAKSLEVARPVYDAAWSQGELPRVVIACASTPTVGGFYIDQPEDSCWETLVASEFPDAMRRRFNASNDCAVIGASMGGYGALKLAFREPQRYAAVAALSPAIFPGETPAGVPERNVPSVLGDLHRAMGADDSTYRHNSVYGIARANADRIRAAEIGIFFDCGDADEFALHDGAEFLHGLLQECAISHEFHSIAGAGHADASANRRLADAIAFVGGRLHRA